MIRIFSTLMPTFVTAALTWSTSPPGSTTAPTMLTGSQSSVQFCWNGVTGTMAALRGPPPSDADFDWDAALAVMR